MTSTPRSRIVPAALLAAYLILFIALGVKPYDRAVWWAENIPIFLIAVLLTVLYLRGLVLSHVSYALMSVLLFLHTIGGHYTFERVPFDWFSHAFGFKRNQYDRIAHFSVGFYAYGIAEALELRTLVAKRWVGALLGVCAIGTIAALYEIIEWIYAALEGGSAGAAFLGSQGDIWDAQKDMLADILGALLAATVYLLVRGAGKLQLGSARSPAA